MGEEFDEQTKYLNGVVRKAIQRTIQEQATFGGLKARELRMDICRLNNSIYLGRLHYNIDRVVASYVGD